MVTTIEAQIAASERQNSAPRLLDKPLEPSHSVEFSDLEQQLLLLQTITSGNALQETNPEAFRAQLPIPIVVADQTRQQLSTLLDNQRIETCGTMQIDFLRSESGSPQIQIQAFQPQEMGDSGAVSYDDGFLTAKPGEIEYHTHPASVNMLHLSYGDIFNLVSGPEFIDPNQDLPTQPFRWITGLIVFSRPPSNAIALQLYLYDLNHFDGVRPDSGLQKLGHTVNLRPLLTR